MLMIQEIMGYVLIGFIGMAVLSIFYLPVWFFLRKRVPLLRQTAFFLLIVCVAVISMATVLSWLAVCLLDGQGVLAVERTLNLVPFSFAAKIWDMEIRKQVTQIIANIIMFIPLGFIYPVAFKQARSFWKTTIRMALFSFIIEFTQYFIGRSADIDDLMLNVSGGMLGYLIFYIFSRIFQRKKVWEKLNGTAP